MKALIIGVLLVLGGCRLGAGSGASVWAFNDSTNNYVVLVSEDDAFDLPAHTGGFVAEGSALTLEVLDAASCTSVAAQPVTHDVLINIDQQGRVDFITQHEQPRMTALDHSGACLDHPADATP